MKTTCWALARPRAPYAVLSTVPSVAPSTGSATSPFIGSVIAPVSPRHGSGLPASGLPTSFLTRTFLNESVVVSGAGDAMGLPPRGAPV